MKRKILALVAVLMTVWAGLAVMNPSVVMATNNDKDCGAGTFLGFRPWYAGLCKSGEKEFEAPANGDHKALALFIWTIVLNVTFDLTLAVGYIALGFVIYGGYLYIMSQGDPSRMAKGKKTLMSAIIGTIIAMLASVAVNTVRVILGITNSDITGQKFDQDTIASIFTWAYTVAGLIAVIFIIKGGIDYIIGHGDPGKIRIAQQTIIYAVVGLVIVLLAALITTFVISSTGEAMQWKSGY